MENSLTSKDCSELRKLIHYDNLKLRQESVVIEEEHNETLDKINDKINHNLSLIDKLDEIEYSSVRLVEENEDVGVNGKGFKLARNASIGS